MAMPFEFANKYKVTFLDFWQLEPRKFLNRAEEEPTRYLSAIQFAGLSSIIAFALDAVAYLIGRRDAGESTGSQMFLALVSLPISLFVSTLFYWAISPRWPIRRKVNLFSIFEFQCYMTAIDVPQAAAFGLLLNPILTTGKAPGWVQFIAGGIVLVVALVLYLNYQNPGLAHLASVSQLRMFLGTTLWGLVLWAVMSIVWRNLIA